MTVRGQGVNGLLALRTHVDLRNEPALYGPDVALPLHRGARCNCGNRTMLRCNTFSGYLDTTSTRIPGLTTAGASAIVITPGWRKVA